MLLQLIAGGVVSTTVTTKVHDAVFPALSAAVHVTVVAPRLKAAPLATLQVALLTPEPESDAEGLKARVACAVEYVLVAMVVLPGHAIVGGVVSAVTQA